MTTTLPWLWLGSRSTNVFGRHGGSARLSADRPNQHGATRRRFDASWCLVANDIVHGTQNGLDGARNDGLISSLLRVGYQLDEFGQLGDVERNALGEGHDRPWIPVVPFHIGPRPIQVRDISGVDIC
jgi:hypothetical protein